MSARMWVFVKVVVFCVFFCILAPRVYAGVSFSPIAISLANPIIGDSFTTQATASGATAGAVYYLKCRIGQTSSSLGEGQTYNEKTTKWLDDTNAWIDMPTITIQEDGSWKGAILCRIKLSAADETKLLFLRSCLQVNDACGTSFQSKSSLSLSPVLPTATVTPVATPTVTTTPAKSPTNTPESFNNLITVTSTVYPSSKPTSFVKILSQVKIEDEMVSEGAVLGKVYEIPKNASGSAELLTQKRPYIIALLCVGIGLALFAAVSVVKIRYTKNV